MHASENLPAHYTCTQKCSLANSSPENNVRGFM